MAIGAKHLEELSRSQRGRRGQRRARKDENNQKGIGKIVFVGEDDKHGNEEAVGKTILAFGEIAEGVHFEIAIRPEGVKGDSPVFVRVKEAEINEDKKPGGEIYRISNCRNLSDNKLTWLPASMPVVIVD